jgi:hypothetical protein
MRKVTPFLVIVALVILPSWLFSQDPGNFATSLHGTRQGKFTWYGSANGGMESLTGIPMSQLGCHKCHPGTYANGDAVNPATYQPGCNDCHNFTQGTAVADQICLKCHSRQGTERNLGYQDVHVLKGFKCTSCHTKKEMHGDGKTYASMLDPGATEVTCETCHTSLPSNTSHSLHQTKVQCTACHVKSVISCYNCHIESYVEGGIRRHYGPQRDFIFLVNREGTGKVYPASFQTASYDGKTFLAIAPFTPHTVMKEGRACSECHNNAAIQEYDQTGKITVTRWDTTQKKIISPTGVIPVTSDWQQALQIDYLDYTGDPKSATTDPAKWVFLKSTADGQQMLYAQPLTADQLGKLRLAVGVEEKQNQLPDDFRLMQNFPNPFNPQTTIEFHLPSPTVVTLKIYNLMGFEVKTLLSNEKLEAGVYKFSVGIDELTSGVYFYQLVTPAFTQTRKMTVLR